MSRSGYTDECDGWSLVMWRGAVTSATKGKRGQKLLRDLLAALDAMPVKRLIADELEHNGEVCALGAVGRTRQIDMTKLDPEEPEQIGAAFNIAPALAQEITYMNDEYAFSWINGETPEQRWVRMREWIARQITKGEFRKAQSGQE